MGGSRAGVGESTSHHRVRYKVKENDEITVKADLQEQTEWQAEASALSVVYADEALIVINKPAGLVVHPAAGNPGNTLVNALLHHYPELADIPRAGLIHRLDKDTTGLLVVARTLAAYHDLVKQLQERRIHRQYYCIVRGKIISGGTIERHEAGIRCTTNAVPWLHPANPRSRIIGLGRFTTIRDWKLS